MSLRTLSAIYERRRQRLNWRRAHDTMRMAFLITSIIKVLLQFLFFNLLSMAGRREYVDYICEGKIGNLITTVPLILVLALANVYELLALWLAFGICTLILLLECYHGSYKPNYARFYWLTVSQWLAYLIMGIVYIMVPFDYKLITHITVSSIFLAVLLSLIVQRPFTSQFAQAHKFPRRLRLRVA
jgi:hypothetical protein